MSNGSCIRFNNAAEKVFRGTRRPVVLVRETDDSDQRWQAEARLVSNDGEGQVLRVGQGSASKKQVAKDAAASLGYHWLRAQYPSIDLSNV